MSTTDENNPNSKELNNDFYRAFDSHSATDNKTNNRSPIHSDDIISLSDDAPPSLTDEQTKSRINSSEVGMNPYEAFDGVQQKTSSMERKLKGNPAAPKDEYIDPYEAFDSLLC